MSNDVELVATRHVGWIYLTEHGYATLPSYWTNEVLLCQHPK
jgi:hypothetical protein